MKQPRLHRIFNPDSNRSFTVALDHGLSNERSLLQGIENIERAIQVVALAGPDAVQLSSGQAPLLQMMPGRQKPSLILRADVTNVYGPSAPQHLYTQLIEQPVEQALRLDAAAVVASLIRISEKPEVGQQCVQNILKLKPACDAYGMPLMIEAQVLQLSDKGATYLEDRDMNKITPLVRQAAELGADIVKADPTTDLSSYRKVVEAARVPVLVRGGTRSSDRELLERTEQVTAQGAGGVVYGRNIVQHPDPAGLTRAVMAIVHERARAIDALRFIRS